MDQIGKLKHTIDALFGSGISKNLPKDLDIVYSRKNGRIKEVYHKENLLCTLRIDGGLAVTPFFAQLLSKNKKFGENCIEIDSDSEPFVREGKSVFCGHVVWAGKNILIGADVPILFDGKVIAVGRAVVNPEMMLSLKRGVAVKVRNSLKTGNGE